MEWGRFLVLWMYGMMGHLHPDAASFPHHARDVRLDVQRGEFFVSPLGVIQC